MSDIEQACIDVKQADQQKTSNYDTYMMLDKIKIIEQIHYIVKHDTLKQEETLKLLELRDNIINSL